MDAIEHVLKAQDGVISRRQALSAGLNDHDVRRLLRRREWAGIHLGIYVNHTGPLTWHQRAWAGVLLLAPGALYGSSAIRAADGPGSRHDERIIHVAVEQQRSARALPPDVRMHRVALLDAQVQWNLGPPRQRYEDAALDCAASATSALSAIGWLAKGAQTRRTTAQRMLAALELRPRIAQRDFIEATLGDVAAGTCSVLEHGFLVNVERPHGYPKGLRQERATASTGIVYRDLQYADHGIVELDGRLHHDSTERRDADFERDLDAAVGGLSTIRLSYGQVFDRPCSTAAKVAIVLRNRGVDFEPHACGPGCLVGRLFVA